MSKSKKLDDRVDAIRVSNRFLCCRIETSLRNELDQMLLKLDNLLLGSTARDFREELALIDSRFPVMLPEIRGASKLDQEIAGTINRKLNELRSRHDAYLRSAEAELEG